VGIRQQPTFIVCRMHYIAALDRILNHLRVRCLVSGVRSKCEKLRMAITQQRVIRSTSRLVPGWGF